MNNQHTIIPNGRIGSHANSGVSQHERTNGERSFQGLQKLAQVSSKAGDEATGNVHSGGPPPWFSSTDEKLPNEKQRSGKLSKLNPKRVGAAWAERRKMEMEMEKRGEIVTTKYDSNWLPDFGRVWQSGSRKESRKEFQVEINTSHKDEIQAVMPTELQPYVSKRQCPKQIANDGIFCGHYVGCFIEDVLRSGETNINVNFTRSNRLMCYARDKLDRFRDNWAGFLYNRFLKGKLLNM